MEGRLKSRNSVDLLLHKTRIHRHIVVKKDFALCHLNTFNLDDILIRIELDVIAQTDDRHNRAKFQRDLSSDHNDTIQKIPALIDIRKRYDSIAKFQFNRIHLQKGNDILRSADLLCLGLLCRDFFLDALLADTLGDRIAGDQKCCTKGTEQDRVQRCYQTQKDHRCTNNIKYLWNTK